LPTFLPVIASNHGSLKALVEHSRTGHHFAGGDRAELASEVRWVPEHPQ
jgi:hypothetical protein